MDYNLKGLSVFLAMPVQEDLPIETVVSLFSTDAHLRKLGVTLNTTFQIGGTLCGSRSQAAADFLASGANRLLCIDSDMVWKPEDVVRLLAMSTAMDIVVGSLCHAARSAGLLHPRPGRQRHDGQRTRLRRHRRDGPWVLRHQPPGDRGSVSQGPNDPVPGSKPIPELFRFTVNDGQFRGEDIAFFEDARAAGYQCWMDTSIQLGHVGRKVFSAKLNLREA
jgi:hypothetical protein